MKKNKKYSNKKTSSSFKLSPPYDFPVSYNGKKKKSREKTKKIYTKTKKYDKILNKLKQKRKQ